jgi:hypothetical protein
MIIVAMAECGKITQVDVFNDEKKEEATGLYNYLNNHYSGLSTDIRMFQQDITESF